MCMKLISYSLNISIRSLPFANNVHVKWSGHKSMYNTGCNEWLNCSGSTATDRLAGASPHYIERKALQLGLRFQGMDSEHGKQQHHHAAHNTFYLIRGSSSAQLRIDGSIKAPVQMNKYPTARGRHAMAGTWYYDSSGLSRSISIDRLSFILHTCCRLARLINVMQIHLNLSLSGRRRSGGGFLVVCHRSSTAADSLWQTDKESDLECKYVHNGLPNECSTLLHAEQH